MSGKTRDETVRDLYLVEQSVSDPDVIGLIRNIGGILKARDSVGVFELRSGGGGISEAQHEALDTLTHFVAEDNWEEIVRTGGKVSNVIHWTQEAEPHLKIREVTVQRTSGKVSQIDLIQYDVSGVEKVRLTLVINRTAGKVSSIQWTKTVA